MASFSDRVQRAAPFYQHYWDFVETESFDDPKVGVRNTVIEAIIDLLCFATGNNVDTDVVLEQAKKTFVEIKMQLTLSDNDPLAE